jgi:hypothetical protein
MSKTCHDCGCSKGQLHTMGCSVERCPRCGKQLISCDCNYKFLKKGERIPYNSKRENLLYILPL